MSITFRHPDPSHHMWQWLAAGAAAVVLSAGAFTGIRAITGSGTPDRSPAITYADPYGLGEVFGVDFPPSDLYADPSGLGAIFGVSVPSPATYVDPSGLGIILGGTAASQPADVAKVPPQNSYVDPSGLGQVLSVEVPAGPTT